MKNNGSSERHQNNNLNVMMTSSAINYKVLAEIHPEFGNECYVSKEVPKEDFLKHIYSLIT